MEGNSLDKINRQIKRAGLPTGGEVPFEPKLVKNRNGDSTIKKDRIRQGPKRGKFGYVDVKGRIWIKDRAHANAPDHWDVQVDGGKDYFRVDPQGKKLP